MVKVASTLLAGAATRDRGAGISLPLLPMKVVWLADRTWRAPMRAIGVSLVAKPLAPMAAGLAMGTTTRESMLGRGKIVQRYRLVVVGFGFMPIGTSTDGLDSDVSKTRTGAAVSQSASAERRPT